MTTRTSKLFGLTVLVFFTAISEFNIAEATVITTPNTETIIEGNSNNGFPFNISDFSLSSMRYQQIFAASDFSSLSGPELINQILFRPDAITGNQFDSTTLNNVQINLSTTNVSPFSLSNFFGNNIGVDDTIVFSGPLTLSSAYTGPAGGPKDFDIIINLATPFLYDPTKGNLLLDVRNFNGGLTTQFDSTDSSTTTSRLFYSDVNSDSGIVFGSQGLITRFVTVQQQIPEPASIALLGIGLTGLAFVRRRRRNTAC